MVSRKTDNIYLIWKARNAFTETSFSNEHTVPNAFTAEVFTEHLLTPAETVTRTLRQEGEEYQCSDGLKKDFCINRLRSHDTFFIPELTVYEAGKYISSVGDKKSAVNDSD